MNHAPARTNGAQAGHESHSGDSTATDGTTPVKSPVPVRMTPALNDHSIVADILASRARSISIPRKKRWSSSRTGRTMRTRTAAGWRTCVRWLTGLDRLRHLPHWTT